MTLPTVHLFTVLYVVLIAVSHMMSHHLFLMSIGRYWERMEATRNISGVL